MDTEQVYWDPEDHRYCDIGMHYLKVLRVYYIPGSPNKELIGKCHYEVQQLLYMDKYITE